MNNFANENIINNGSFLETCLFSGQRIEIEESILTLLINDGAKTTEVLAKELGSSVLTIFDALTALNNDGKIKYFGESRHGVWVVNESPNVKDIASSIEKDTKKGFQHKNREKLHNKWVVVDSTNFKYNHNDFQGDVIELLRKDGKETLKSLSSKLNIPTVTIYMTLEDLLDEGKIKWC